jgi:hypothetical protein
MPFAAMLPVAVYWVWQWVSTLRVDSDSIQQLRAERRRTFVGSVFFVAMLLYPQLSASILSALRCRRLGEESYLLEADYSVDCTSARYSEYRSLALVLVIIVPIGFPLTLLSALMYQWRQSKRRWNEADCDSDELRQSLSIESEVGGDLDVESLTEYHRKRAEESFGFCTEDYRPECFWFEPVDLLRKLALSGLLQFVHRGTAAQCFCGSTIAFASFGVQQWLRPYREYESNILKALVDTQLFLTFLISFILRVLPEIHSAEPFHATFYGWLLLSTMGVLLALSISLTIVQVRRRQRFKAGLLSNEIPLGELTRSSSELSELPELCELLQPGSSDDEPLFGASFGSFTVAQETTAAVRAE